MATPAHTSHAWRFGVFEVDAQREEVRRAGVPVKLREQSLRVLVSLLEKPGELVTREHLRGALWPADTFVDFDHSLNTAVMKLREALGDTADKPLYIETIPKRGYRFIAPVTSIAYAPEHPLETGSAMAPTQLNAAPPQEPVKSVAPSTPRRIPWMIAAAGILLVAATATLVFLQLRHPKIPPGSESSSYRIDAVTTFRGAARHPAITPDGRDVAFAWNGGGGDHWDIYVQRIGSLVPMRLTYIKTGVVGYPAWSPDQTEIAFTRCDGINAINDGVYIVPALGGPERKLTSTSCQYHAPNPVVWLPELRMLMMDRCPASGLQALILFSMDTGEKRCLADFGLSGFERWFHHAVSPDQRNVAFIPSQQSPVCEIYTMPLSGGEPRRILEDPGPCYDLMWTPDGKDIVFQSQRTKLLSFWQVPANGGEIRESRFRAIGSYSKDGRRFVYAERSGGELSSIWRADLASPGGKVLDNKKLIATQFWETEQQPSPDGARLVWGQERGGDIQELWTGSAAGENPLQLTHLNLHSGSARWSPDGKSIAFDSSLPVEGSQIFIIDAEGRNLRQITQGRYLNVVPSWSRDGKSIYFTSTRSGNKEVWKHSLETGKETQLTTHGGFNPFESFDGQSIYFSKFDEAGIWSMPVQGGKETLVLEGRPQLPHWGDWALTRPGIYFMNADAYPRARIEFYDFATRRILLVLSLEKNAVWAGACLSATTDGKTVFYDQLDIQSTIKMMEFSR